MKIRKIIETIEILKSDFWSRYKVMPNICLISSDAYQALRSELDEIILAEEAAEVPTISGMKLEIDMATSNSVQVGYFSKPCRVDWEANHEKA